MSIIPKSERIYILVIDGTEVYIPVDTKKLKSNKYEFLNSEDYNLLDENDFSELWEFEPGDSFYVKNYKFSNGTNGKIAYEDFIDTNNLTFRKFLFRILKNNLDKSDINLEGHIKTLHLLYQKGVYFYPGIIDWLNK